MHRKIQSLANSFKRKIRLQSLIRISSDAWYSAPPEIIDHIEKLSGTKLLPENWKKWLDLNRDRLGDLIFERWDFPFFALPGGAITKNRSILKSIPYEVEQKEYYITKEPTSEFFDKFDIVSTSLLKGVSPIPNLWLIVAKFAEPISTVPSELAHDTWIVDFLRGSFGLSLNKNESQIKEFIQDNKETINKVRSFFETSPKELGSGADGMVFDIGGEKVLKLFRSAFAFQEANKTIERLFKYPELAKTEAMIYDTGVFEFKHGKLQGAKFYYYVMERMVPITTFSNDLRIAIMDIVYSVERTESTFRSTLEGMGKWMIIKKNIDNPKLVKDDIKNITQMALEDLNEEYHNPMRMLFIQKQLDLSPNWLETFVEEIIMKSLTGRVDLHSGNLGATRYGQLRFFDPTI